MYWNEKDCCAGVFCAITSALATAIGEPWTSLPMVIMLFGRGGGVGWGSLCGCLNGGAALISLVATKANSVPLITELWVGTRKLNYQPMGQIKLELMVDISFIISMVIWFRMFLVVLYATNQ